MPDKHALAQKIWQEVFDSLYDRAAFDHWWDDIDDAIQNEINVESIQVIEGQL
jgi:hypothetical protein